MKISIVTYGTRGDVQPFVALAVGLQRAGHTVRFAAPEVFAPLVAPWHIEFVGLPGDPMQLSQDLVDRAGTNPLLVWQVMYNYALPLGTQVLSKIREVCLGAEAIVSSFLLMIGAHKIACEFGIPHFSGELFPAFASSAAYPNLLFPALGGARYNRFTHWAFAQLYWQANKLGYNFLARQARQNFSGVLPNPFTYNPPTILTAISPRVLPTQPDWQTNIKPTGYWFLDSPAQWIPPIELQKFLDAGSPPICLTIGSMVTKDAQKISGLMLEALALTKQRGIVLGGWSALGARNLPDTILSLPSVPHDWLFPRVITVVHHGGAGTTAAALRAGVPAIITPLTADQPFWGKRVQQLGVGQSIPMAKLNASLLAHAIEVSLNDSAARATAASLGAAIRAEDGVARAVEIIFNAQP